MRTPSKTVDACARRFTGCRRWATKVSAVVIIMVFLLPGSGKAMIVIDGDGVFTTQVAAALTQIAASDPSKAALISSLSDSAHTITIRKTVRVDSSTDSPNAKAASTKGVGTNSTVHWNPTATPSLFCGGTVDPTAALFHELVHASHYDAGTWTQSAVKGPDGSMSAEEVAATVAENMYRMKACLPLRTCYGTQRLPQTPPSTAPCSTTTTSSITTTTTSATTTTTVPNSSCTDNQCDNPAPCGQNGSGASCNCAGPFCATYPSNVCIDFADCLPVPPTGECSTDTDCGGGTLCIRFSGRTTGHCCPQCP